MILVLAGFDGISKFCISMFLFVFDGISHCVKGTQIVSFFGLYFYKPEKNPFLVTFHAVLMFLKIYSNYYKKRDPHDPGIESFSYGLIMKNRHNINYKEN